MRWLLILSCVALGGCRESKPASAGLKPDAGAPTPPPLVLSVSVEAADAGTFQPVRMAAPDTVVPASQGLLVESNLALRGPRIRVLDEADRVVPSDDKLEEQQTALRYRIRFLEPL